MPRATVSTQPERFDLKSLPEGYVVIKRMSYGMWLHRQEMALVLSVSASQSKEFEGEMNMANKEVTAFEFQVCIVEHNLEDDNGVLLNFNNPASLDILDPVVGNEIGDIITQLHEFNQGNSNPALAAL